MHNKQVNTPKLAYSIKEACEATSLGKTTIFGHIASGRLKASRVGGRTLILAKSLEAFIEGETSEVPSHD